MVLDYRTLRIRNLLVENKVPRDMRGINIIGNAIPGNICTKIHEHISLLDVKLTHYGGKSKKYLDARLNVQKIFDRYCEVQF